MVWIWGPLNGAWAARPKVFQQFAGPPAIQCASLYEFTSSVRPSKSRLSNWQSCRVGQDKCRTHRVQQGQRSFAILASVFLHVPRLARPCIYLTCVFVQWKRQQERSERLQQLRREAQRALGQMNEEQQRLKEELQAVTLILLDFG